MKREEKIRAALAAELAGLQAANPALAGKFSICKHGTAVGFRLDDATILMITSAVIGSDVLMNCGYGDGRYPTFPAKDW